MRGKDHNEVARNKMQGITPAYAGKRTLPSCVNIVTWITPAYAGKSYKDKL